MIKVQRTAWALAQEGVSNEKIAEELSRLTGRDLTSRVVAVNIGRFNGKIENDPDKLFDSLLEDSDIRDAEELADILVLDYDEAREIINSKTLTREQMVQIIQYYDMHIADPGVQVKKAVSAPPEPEPESESEPEPESQPQPHSLKDEIAKLPYKPNDPVVDYVLQDTMVTLTVHETLKALLKHAPNKVNQLVEVLAIPLDKLGDTSAPITLAGIQSKFEVAKKELEQRVNHEVNEILTSAIEKVKKP